MEMNEFEELSRIFKTASSNPARAKRQLNAATARHSKFGEVQARKRFELARKLL